MRTIILAAVILIVGLFVIWEGTKWIFMRVYVPENKALLVINKFGDELPADRTVVPLGKDDYKGVREEVLGPGRYFLNPVSYETQLVDLVEIPAGDPTRWEFTADGRLKDEKTAPMVGLVTMKEGKTPPQDAEVVDHGFKGLQREVLTPGTYKINPYQMEVRMVPAVVVPAGSVGVRTLLIGDRTNSANASLTQIREASSTQPSSTQPAVDVPATQAGVPSRLVTTPGQRGIQAEVLQPGIYYVNPRAVKITIVPIGYDEISLNHSTNNSVSFFSNDGYKVEADFTVVWGRGPSDAPHIVANIGGVDKVEKNVVEPAMKAACQNEGAKYSAKELIQGTTRSKFQDDLSASLEKQVSSRNLHVLLALIRNISIKDSKGGDQTDGLLRTIQRANIEIERDLTNQQKTQTASTSAALEEALKQVDTARETVSADTTVKVANILAEGKKTAAETDAQREVEISTIALEIAQLDAQRDQILGKAAADVDRLKREAEAKGAKMMIDAFGSPQAYNLYTFAKNFQPKDLRVIFAGPGTFWTDLKTFQEIGAAKSVQTPAPKN